MIPVAECRPCDTTRLLPGLRTFGIGQNWLSCRIGRPTIVLSKWTHRSAPMACRVVGMAMIAVRLCMTPEPALETALGVRPLPPSVATALGLFPGRSTERHLKVIAPTAPVGVGWG